MMRAVCLRARRGSGDDEGFGLVYVLLISVLVLIILGTASTTLIAQIRPTTTSIDTGAAVAAAEAGLEDFVAQVNKNCSASDGFYCPTLATGWSSSGSAIDPTMTAGTPVTGVAGNGTHAWFWWRVRYAVPGIARVKVYGQVLSGKANPMYRTRALVADIKATPSFANFEYYTKYETFPADFVDSFYAARHINISATSLTGSSLPSGAPGGSLDWNGTCFSTDSDDPNHCTGAGGGGPVDSTNICNDLYYQTSSGDGRGSDDKWNNTAPGRRPSAGVQAALGTDKTFAYYSESGTFTPYGSSIPVAETHNDTCDSTFEPNMVMNGPVYSEDAYLIDQGDCTGNSPNSEPTFNGPAYSLYNGTVDPATPPSAPGPNGGYQRTYPNAHNCGYINSSVPVQPVYTPDELSLPATPDGALASQTCIYTGPTRILLNGAYAYVTSPMTDPSTTGSLPSCYQSRGDFRNTGPGVVNGGVVNAQVPINSTVIYVADPDLSTHPAATAASPIFDLTTNVALPATQYASALAGNFTAGTYSVTSQCPATLGTRRGFDCLASGTADGSVAPDVLSQLQSAVDTEIRSADADGDLQSTLQAKLKALMPGGYVDTPPTTLDNNKAKYTVTVSAPSAGTTTTTATPTQSDGFYQSTSGSYTTTPYTWSIKITRYSCSRTGGCTSSQLDNPKDVVTGSATRTESAALTNSTSRWPWAGSTNVATDPNNDVTQYATNWGDAYVQGTLTGQLTIAAEHDVVATGDITYTNQNVNTTSDGLALVATHNVRIYRPMTCKDPEPAAATTPTTAGYCPDDLTGVYPAPPSWPVNDQQTPNYPTAKYVRDNAPAMFSATKTTGTIDATMFALQGCFMADNFYRGGSTGRSLSIYGGLYQNHRGPTSLPIQGKPYQGNDNPNNIKMPGMVLTYNYDNMRAGQDPNAGFRVPWIPNPTGRPTGSPRPWNVVSVSTEN